MNRKISFLMLLLVFYSKAQNNNTAVNTGYWNSKCTWNFPATIYNNTSLNLSDYVKTIEPNTTVIQNLPEVYTNKIILSNDSKVYLVDNDHKISFTESGSPISTTDDCGFGFLDYAVVDFAEPVVAKSLSGFIHGLTQSTPIDDNITPLQSRLMRQGLRSKYKRAYDLTNPEPNNSNSTGRVHIILSDSWAKRCWTPEELYDEATGIQYNFPGNQCTELNTTQEQFKKVPTSDGLNGECATLYKDKILKHWFDWGKYTVSPSDSPLTPKPGIVWECWNEPDVKDFWDSSNPLWSTMNGCHPEIWPEGLRNGYFETYKMFYKTIRSSGLPSNALVAGPSLGNYSEEKMKAFLEFCLTNYDDNGNPLQVNVVTWHELAYSCTDGVPYVPISYLKDHVKNFKDKFMNNPRYTPLQMQSIEINEIIGDIYKNNPAASASYLGYLEQAGVNYASKACWSESLADSGCYTCPFGCTGVTLNHLFNFSDEKKADWWVYKLYADGVKNRVKSYNTEARSIIIASKETKSVPETNSYAQVLFGYSDTRERVNTTGPISYPAPLLPLNGNYKIQLNNVNIFAPDSDTNTTFYYKIRKIPFTGVDSMTSLNNPEPDISSTTTKDSNNTIFIEYNAEIEYLYELSISTDANLLPLDP